MTAWVTVKNPKTGGTVSAPSFLVDRVSELEAELDAVMQLGIDKWLSVSQLEEPSYATRASMARERILELLESQEAALGSAKSQTQRLAELEDLIAAKPIVVVPDLAPRSMELICERFNEATPRLITELWTWMRNRISAVHPNQVKHHGQAELCTWSQMEPGDKENWETGCDRAWTFPHGDFRDNDVVYCPHCGGKITLKSEEVSDVGIRTWQEPGI